MGQRGSYLYEKMVGKQDTLIRELQQNIALLEQQNSLQQELIASLQEENRILREYLDQLCGHGPSEDGTACDQEG